jgi:hypothetical protein
VGDLANSGAAAQYPEPLADGVSDMLVSHVVESLVVVGDDKSSDFVFLR